MSTGSLAGAISIAVLGTGAMGSRLAANLANAGHRVTVWNRTPQAAHEAAVSAPLSVASSARDAVMGATVVMSMVRDDEAARHVWLDASSGVLAALGPGTIAVESSTLSVATTQELASAAARAGVPFVAAPVLGSRPQADAGALVYLVGGEAEALESVRAVLEVNAAAVHLVGAPGDAALMKLMVNGLLGMQAAMAAEAVALLERSTIDSERALEILGGLPVTSPALQRLMTAMSQRSFSPNFPVRLVVKDLAYLESARGAAQAAGPMAEAAMRVFAGATGAGFGALDITGVARVYLE